jgi:flagellar biosynthesis/type III secretory pathway chaperone
MRGSLILLAQEDDLNRRRRHPHREQEVCDERGAKVTRNWMNLIEVKAQAKQYRLKRLLCMRA